MKETGVENPRLSMVHVGVEIPRMKARRGVSREILSQVTKFTLNSGYHQQMTVTEAERMAQPQRAGMTGGGRKTTCVNQRCHCFQNSGVSTYGAQSGQPK